MKKTILVAIVLAYTNFAQAQVAQVCQTIGGVQFVWVGHVCPAGTMWVGF